jgi:hypothetical protein
MISFSGFDDGKVNFRIFLGSSRKKGEQHWTKDPSTYTKSG